jgi:serine/threonine protein phosphatase PrpC
MPTLFTVAGCTDVGQAREVNEDTFAIHTAEGVWLVADGMGGHASGQVASHMVKEKIEDFLFRWRKESDFEWPFEIMESRSHIENSLVNAIRVANVRIYNRAQIDGECAKMGTTVVLMSYDPSVGFVVANVGDSRCYRLRDDDLYQITEDHSLVNHLMKTYHISRAKAEARAGSNVIVRAVGLEDDVDADLYLDMPMDGDIYMACSDGLTDLVDEWIIQNILQGNADDPQEAANALVRAANQAGGTDNITVVVLQASER